MKKERKKATAMLCDSSNNFERHQRNSKTTTTTDEQQSEQLQLSKCNNNNKFKLKLPNYLLTKEVLVLLKLPIVNQVLIACLVATLSRVCNHYFGSSSILLVTAAPTSTQSARLIDSHNGELDALNYLRRYGYMNESSMLAGSLVAEQAFNEAVLGFQRFAGINETGIVDSQTMTFMQMPRCGNKDKFGKSSGESGKRRKRKKRKKRRKKRYALQGSKWRKQQLTYRISQYPVRFSNKKQQVDVEIQRAFDVWAAVAPIEFVHKREGRVNIDIRFASGEHGDGDPFDGPGNTLAHAYFPQYGGDAHFDDQEYWTIDSYTGTNLFQVAAHELGHALGLGHSSVREALMAPFYQRYKPNFKLHPDDILGIQALYGEGPIKKDDDEDNASDGSESRYSPKPSTTSTTTTTENPLDPRLVPTSGGGNDIGTATRAVDLCTNSRIDAITRVADGSTYVFRGHHYWLVTNEGLGRGYPRRISKDWEGLPANIDAALTWSDGKTFFFKGDKYWRFFNKRREPGYPKLISNGFAGIPNNVDTAFVWSGNGKTYFFKRDKYYRFDSKQEPPVGAQYPKSVSNWEGLPKYGVDAAFKWENGMTYFFEGNQYYRFDDREFAVEANAQPKFPRSTPEWWFGCPNSNLPLVKASDNDLMNPSASSLATVATYDDNNEKRSVDSYDYENDGHLRSDKPKIDLSISSSIFKNLSKVLPASLLPSSSSSSTNSTNASNRSTDKDCNTCSPIENKQVSDWSFHRGISEEVRKLLGGSSSGSNGGTRTSWLLPLSSSPGRGEMSLSELKVSL